MPDVVSSGRSAPDIPKGRTKAYTAYRVCERFGQNPDWFVSLPSEKQNALIVYEHIRQTEESEMRTAFAKVGVRQV